MTTKQWPHQELGLVLERVRNGLSVQQSQQADGLPITRIETIADGCINVERVGYAGLALGKYDEWLLREGELLMSHINSVPHLGKCALYDGCPKQLIHGMNLLALRPNPQQLDSRYLLHALRSPAFRRQLPKITKRSVNQSSFTISSLKALTIPLPPLSEQRRIAAILDKADAIRRKREEGIRLTEELLRSTFLEMFGDPVTNPKRWKIVPLSQYGNVTTGNTPSRQRPEYFGEGIEWVKSDNIDPSEFVIGTAKERLTEVGQQVARTVQPGSTLVTCIAGSIGCIGDAGIVDHPVAFNQQINAITPAEYVDPWFLLGLIRFSKRLIQAASTESMKGLVSKSKFENVRMILPPGELQSTFGERFRKIVSVIQVRRASVRAASDLFAALVQRAFRGEL